MRFSTRLWRYKTAKKTLAVLTKNSITRRDFGKEMTLMECIKNSQPQEHPVVSLFDDERFPARGAEELIEVLAREKTPASSASSRPDRRRRKDSGTIRSRTSGLPC